MRRSEIREVALSRPATASRPLPTRTGRTAGSPLAAFLRNEKGSFAIEFAIWVPLVMALLLATVDISVSFFGYARMWDVARDTARRAATGQLAAAEAEAHAAAQLNPAWRCDVSVDDSGREDVVVTISSSNLGPVFGVLDWFAPGDLTAALVVRKETLALAQAE